jgi:hypothetical protein
MKCALCGNKTTMFTSWPVNVGHGLIEKIDSACLVKLGIKKTDIRSQNAIKRFSIDSLRKMIENGETFSYSGYKAEAKHKKKLNKENYENYFAEFKAKGSLYYPLIFRYDTKQIFFALDFLKNLYQIHSFSEITDFKIDKNETFNSNTKKDISFSKGITGYLIAGSTGGVIGASSGNSSTKTLKEVSAITFTIRFYDGSYTSFALSGHPEDIVNANKIELELKKIVNENNSSSSHSNNLSDLRELKSLFDDGIITQEEFDLKKKELLGL